MAQVLTNAVTGDVESCNRNFTCVEFSETYKKRMITPHAPSPASRGVLLSPDKRASRTVGSARNQMSGYPTIRPSGNG